MAGIGARREDERSCRVTLYSDQTSFEERLVPRRHARGIPIIGPAQIARPGFVEWMGRHDLAPIRVICAPAGYGKTCALLGWAGSSPDDERTIVWITLDQTVVDRTAFWALVLHHLGSAGTAIDPQLVSTLRNPSESAPFLSSLLAGQFESAGPVVLVVDTGLVHPDSAVVADLLRMAEQLPRFQVVIAAQEQPDLLRESRRGEVIAEFPSARLLFSVEEVTEAAARRGIELSADGASRILDASAGWPVAVLAALDDAGTGASRSTASHAARIIDPFRPDVGFASLLVASLCDVVRIADLALLGLADSVAPLVTRLADAGLGFWGDSPQRTFRLLPMVREALRAEFAASDPEGKRRAHREIALLYEKRPDGTGTAFAHAIEAEDWELTARVYRRRLLAITERPTGSTLSTRGLPARAQHAHPILRFAVALDDFSNGRRARAFQGLTTLLAVAERRHLMRQTGGLDDLWVQALVMTSLRLLGRHELSRFALHRLERMIARTPDPGGEIDEARSVLLWNGATTLLLAGHLEEAAELLDEAGMDPLPDRPPVERARVLVMRALIDVLHGDVHSAEAALSACQAQPLPSRFETTYTAFPGMVAAALAEIERGDVESAERFLSRTDAHAPTTELWSLLLRARVLIAWQQHGAPTAISILEELAGGRARRTMHGPLAAHTIITLRASLMLATGRYAGVKGLLAEAPHPRSRRWSPLRARIELLTGDPDRAATLALTALSTVSTPRERLTLMTVAATASARVGHDEAAVERGAAAVAFARRHRLLLPFTAVPRDEALAVVSSAPDLVHALSELRMFPIGAPPSVSLTGREILVLKHLMEGMTVDGIADALSVSKNTVKTQLRAVYRKLDVNNRTDAIIEARRRHIP